MFTAFLLCNLLGTVLAFGYFLFKGTVNFFKKFIPEKQPDYRFIYEFAPLGWEYKTKQFDNFDDCIKYAYEILIKKSPWFDCSYIYRHCIVGGVKATRGFRVCTVEENGKQYVECDGHKYRFDD